MKKEILIFFTALALLLSLTGCTGGIASSVPVPGERDAGTQSENKSQDGMDAEAPGQTEGTPYYRGFTTASLPEKVKNVYDGGGSNVLVTTDSALYLYDLSQDAVAAEAKTLPSQRGYREERYQPVQNGFVGLLLDLNRPGGGGGLQEGDGGVPSVTCAFYDMQLNKIFEIDLMKALSDVMSEEDRIFGIQNLGAVDVSKDGTKIAVGGSSSLYLYDIAAGAGRRVMTESENMIPGDVRFAGDFRIAFGGAYLPEGMSESVYAYGTVSIDGGELEIHIPQGFCAGGLPGAADGFVLVGEDMRERSGRLLFHPAQGEAKTLQLATAAEGDVAYLSAGGGYFATAVNGEKLTVRIYELATGALLAETSIAEEDIALISRVPDVRILDGLRTAVIIYGQHVDTRIKTVQF